MGIPIREHRDMELDGKGKRKACSYKNSYIQVRCSDKVGGEFETKFCLRVNVRLRENASLDVVYLTLPVIMNIRICPLLRISLPLLP